MKYEEMQDGEFIHTNRIIYLAEQIEKAQKEICKCDDLIRQSESFSKKYIFLYEKEIESKRDRLYYDLVYSIKSLINFSEQLKERFGNEH